MDTHLVTFSFHHKNNRRFIARVSHNDNNYNKFGCLDLNEAERLQFRNAMKHQEYEPLKVESKDLILDNVSHKISIKRIDELEPEQIDIEKIDFLNAASNTDRIQFSSKQPLMAKYKDELYFVDSKLEKEYLELLKNTNEKRGTAIRINVDRVVIANGKLSVNEEINYAGKIIAVVKVPEAFENILKENILKISENSDYNRYMVRFYGRNNVLHRVDPFLIHSSKYDICTDIFANVDYEDLYLPDSESDSDDDFDDE